MKAAVTVKENYEFRRIYRKGKSLVSPQMVLYWQKNRQGQSRLGVTVSTKLGHAVVRNRVRRRFRELTMGAAVIVGRRTLEDFPGGKPLPGRENFVLSRRNITIEGAQVVHSPDEAVAAAAQHARCFVIGGDSVFRQMFPHMTRVYVTKIDAAPHSDVFFPDLDADPAWHCVSAEPRAEHDGVGYQFCVYEKTEA